MQNPFKPTAGKMPPAIIGREDVIEEFIEGLENGAGAPGRLMRIAGVRGTGKTVLLGEIGNIASSRGWMVVDEVATEGLCTRIFNRVMPSKQVASSTVEPSILGVSLGSVQIEHIGPTLRDALASAIKKNGHGLLITLDEVQDAVLDEVRTLAIVLQQLIGDDFDIAFVFAGLPSMIDGVINGKTLTFLRRAVPFELRAVDTLEVALSLEETLGESGMSASDAVVRRLADASQGYPFLIQLVGYYAWQLAKRRGLGSIDGDTAEQGVAIARDRFDSMVIEPALQRVSDVPLAYLLAMALDGGATSNTSDLVDRTGKTSQQLSSCRARLLRDSLIEAPAYGKISFAVPYMADYLNAHREEIMEEIGDGSTSQA